jgi:hypothetical protein
MSDKILRLDVLAHVRPLGPLHGKDSMTIGPQSDEASPRVWKYKTNHENSHKGGIVNPVTCGEVPHRGMNRENIINK